MSARLLATFCLVLGRGSALAESDLVVYLKTGANQPPAPIASMKRELGDIMQTAGYRVQWGGESNSPFLVVVQLNGTCSLPAGYAGLAATPPPPSALASTNVTDGRVLPFSVVNCAAVTQSLASLLSSGAAAQRDFYYGRALGRVIAHELYHILMGTTAHTRDGVSRSCFSTADLVAEHFEFEGAVLSEMRRRPQTVTSTAAAGSEEASGR